MFLVLLAAAAGTSLALLLRGGSLALPADLRALPALALGTVGLIAAEWLPFPGRPGILIVATALVVAGLVQNIQISGAIVTAIGLALTGFVVVINGFLPLSTQGAEAKGLEATGLRQIETSETRLATLGDVVPLPLGPWVVSFGDLIATAGAFIFARSLVGREIEDGLDADAFLAQFLEVDTEPLPPSGPIILSDQPDNYIDLRTPPTLQPDTTAPPLSPPPPSEADRFA